MECSATDGIELSHAEKMADSELWGKIGWIRGIRTISFDPWLAALLGVGGLGSVQRFRLVRPAVFPEFLPQRPGCAWQSFEQKERERHWQLHALAYNLATFLRCIELPEAMVDWSLLWLPPAVQEVSDLIAA